MRRMRYGTAALCAGLAFGPLGFAEQAAEANMVLHLDEASAAKAEIAPGAFRWTDGGVIGARSLRYDGERRGAPYLAATLPREAIRGVEAMTLSLWAKSRPGRRTGFFFSCGYPDDDFRWFMKTRRNGEPFFGVTVGGEQTRLSLGEDFSADRWRHYAMVVDLAGDRRAKVYVDGTLVARSRTFGGGDFYRNAEGELIGTAGFHAFQGRTLPLTPQWRIGGINTKGNAWQGGLDDVRLYTRALSSEAIGRLAKAGED